MDQFINKVFHTDARRLLAAMPDASIDAVITDAMYGTAKNYRYEWGRDPAKGDPFLHWHYHEPIYKQCLRVLKPAGVLAWGQGGKFIRHFGQWFRGHRVWTITRFGEGSSIAVGNIWVVQTREQEPIEFPHQDSVVRIERPRHLPIRKLHPCPKPIEEMKFLIDSLTQPGQIILDCCCGSGSTLIAAQMMHRRWIGCDIGRSYCQLAMKRLALLETNIPQETNEQYAQ